MVTKISSRRRTIQFSGTSVTIKAAVKSGVFGDTRTNSFPVSRITAISNTPPGLFGHGVLKFTVTGESTEALDNPAGGGDRVDMQTFCYGNLETKRVAGLVARIEERRSGSR